MTTAARMLALTTQLAGCGHDLQSSPGATPT
jgi:hypothetical protein